MNTSYQGKFNLNEGIGYCHFCEARHIRDESQLAI